MKLKVLEPWFKDGLQFSCTGCGNCCTGGPGFIWISDEEITLLANHLRLPRKEVLRKYCRKIGGQISLKEKVPNARGEYDCIFLKEVPAKDKQDGTAAGTKRICTVYAVRPLQCRTWPFWKEVVASPESWAAATKRCPGINSGETWSQQRIIARRDAREWPKDS